MYVCNGVKFLGARLGADDTIGVGLLSVVADSFLGIFEMNIAKTNKKMAPGISKIKRRDVLGIIYLAIAG